MIKAETNEVKNKGNKYKICVSQYYMAIAEWGRWKFYFVLQFWYIGYQPYCFKPETSQDVTESIHG